MNEDDTRSPLWDVVLVPFDPRPLPATRFAYADQIRALQARFGPGTLPSVRKAEKEDDSPQP